MPTTDSPCTPTENPSYPPSSTSPKNPSAIALARIETDMVKIIKSSQAFEQEYPTEKEALTSVFHKFFKIFSENSPHLLPLPPISQIPSSPNLGTSKRQ